MRRIQESILEFKLRYGLEILFNTPIPKAIYKSFIAMIKCLIDLIKPHPTISKFFKNKKDHKETQNERFYL